MKFWIPVLAPRKPGVVVHDYKQYTEEIEMGGYRIQGHVQLPKLVVSLHHKRLYLKGWVANEMVQWLKALAPLPEVPAPTL